MTSFPMIISILLKYSLQIIQYTYRKVRMTALHFIVLKVQKAIFNKEVALALRRYRRSVNPDKTKLIFFNKKNRKITN